MENIQKGLDLFAKAFLMSSKFLMGPLKIIRFVAKPFWTARLYSMEDTVSAKQSIFLACCSKIDV